MGSNRIPVAGEKAVDYVNPLLRKNGTVAIKNGTVFGRTATVVWGNGCPLLINGSCNGSQRKLQRERVQWPFPFR